MNPAYSEQRVIDKLRHWRKLYAIQQVELGFVKGSEEDMKHLRSMYQQQIRILQRVGII